MISQRLRYWFAALGGIGVTLAVLLHPHAHYCDRNECDPEAFFITAACVLALWLQAIPLAGMRAAIVWGDPPWRARWVLGWLPFAAMAFELYEMARGVGMLLLAPIAIGLAFSSWGLSRRMLVLHRGWIITWTFLSFASLAAGAFMVSFLRS